MNPDDPENPPSGFLPERGTVPGERDSIEPGTLILRRAAWVRRPVWWIIGMALIIAGAYGWLVRPYDSAVGRDSPVTIESASLQRDRSYFWLDLVLLRHVAEEDWLKDGIFLVSEDGFQTEAAAFQAATPVADGEPQEWFAKFWLDERVLKGPVRLSIGKTMLRVRSSSGTPDVENGSRRRFRTHDW